MADEHISRERTGAGVPPGWATAPERGTIIMLRVMTFISLKLGRRVARIALYGIVGYFYLFAPAPARHMRNYLRHALRREPTRRDRFQLLFSFATTIHDRMYLLNEQYDLFDISIEGVDIIKARVDRGEGVFLMGAHLGSFEILRAVGRRQPGLKVAMAMYVENAGKVNSTLATINPRLASGIIPLGTIDSMLQIQARLDGGTCVGVLGDRTIGGEAVHRVPFLGAPAYFPTSAMRLAAVLRRPVIFMTGLYRGTNRYHVAFEELADFRETAPADRAAAVQTAIERYAAKLERYCTSDPYNWFNFFDFWQDPAARGRSLSEHSA
jgi:predicted LPLAT superfamily acyltransferase